MNTIQLRNQAAIAALQALMREIGYLHPAFQHLALAIALLMLHMEGGADGTKHSLE